MGKSLNFWLKTVLGVSVVVVLLLFGLQWFAEMKLDGYLKKELPEGVELNYSELNVNIFSGNIELSQIDVSLNGEITNKQLINVELDYLQIHDIGYWDYIVGGVVHVSDLIVRAPKVTYRHNSKIQDSVYRSKSQSSFSKVIEVANFNVDAGDVVVANVVNDSLMLRVSNIDFSMKNVRFDEKTQAQKIPIDYQDLSLRYDSLYYRVSDYDDLKTGVFAFNNKQLSLQGLVFKTKYSKQDLSRVIKVERDHYDVVVKELQVKDINFGFRQDSILQIKSPKVLFSEVDADIYRDKLVADDEKIKPLYSKMLRDLNFDLTLDEVELVNTAIRYSEKIKVDKPAGTVRFSDFHAVIKNVSNTYVAPIKTTLDIQTLFMEHAPLQVNWEFDVNSVEDRFLFQAELDDLLASELNSFTVPNLNIRLNGKLDKTYFTINGNDDLSDIDFKTKYQAFDVVILKENGKEKNSFLSGLANIFVSSNSNKAVTDFITVNKEGVTRSKNKSVFNYIWINARAGLLKAMTFE
ncbi:hypothetical protein ACW5R3_06355 [Bizionia sp. KMM 8389]